MVDRQTFMIDGRAMEVDRIDQTVRIGDTEEWTVVINRPGTPGPGGRFFRAAARLSRDRRAGSKRTEAVLIHPARPCSSGAGNVRETMHQVMMPLFWLQVSLYLVLTPMQEFVVRCCLQAPLHAFLNGTKLRRHVWSILVSNLVFAAAHSHIGFWSPIATPSSRQSARAAIIPPCYIAGSIRGSRKRALRRTAPALYSTGLRPAPQSSERFFELCGV